MTIDFVQHYWALLGGSVIGLAVVLFSCWRVWKDSARGRLGAEVRRLELARAEVRKHERAGRKAEARLKRLKSRSESVKPRLIEETAEALSDAKALVKIAGDQVMVAETRVRTIISEEFPPRRHEDLRRRYLEH